MGRAINRLSAKAVAGAKKGYHADGGGLYLLVADTGTASWVFRFRRAGRLREMGLGSAAVFSLAQARVRAAEQRLVLAEGQDPIEARRAARAQPGRCWGQAADEFIETQAHGWKNDAQAAQWRQSLLDYGPDRGRLVADVDTAYVLALLRKIWNTKTETASRVRGRIERVWSAEKAAGHVAGDNPARWRGHLDALLPKPTKVTKVRHHPAMPYTEIPALMVRLRERHGLARRALRFVILTAARTSEALGSEWPEFDLQERVWRVPGERMKAGVAHEVPLGDGAIACLREAAGSQRPFPLTIAAMLELLQRNLGHAGLTVHGFRSSFRDWAAETTSFPPEVVEMALAHTIKSKTEKAYRRGALLEKRRQLMEAWEAYCLGERRTLALVANG